MLLIDWGLQTVGLTKEPNSGRRTQSFTDLGKAIFENDRFIEETGTLFLLQYKLASNKEDATAWYYFFNEFAMSEFTKEDFVAGLQNYVLMSDSNASVAIRSLNDDFTCIINTYLPKHRTGSTKASPENNIDCPFGDLALVDVLSKTRRTYKKTIPSVASIDPWVALAVIQDQAKGRTEIGLNELLTAPCNIGKVFNLDAISMLDLLRVVEKLGELKIIRTAGLDIIRILSDKDFQACVDMYYSSLDEQA